MASSRARKRTLSVVRIGVGYRHGEDFVIDRPAGSGDTLFLHFMTKVLVRTGAGDVHAHKGACVVYGPGRPQWYQGDGGPLVNDWIHFSGSWADVVIRSL